VALAHAHQIFTMGKTGGWALELQGFFFFTALAVALLGAGSYSIGGRSGKWN
ncbi:MAG: GntR family transcriptional regulator, partial [Oxalobacteraceae bacterium]